MPPTNLFRFFLHVLPSFLFFQTGLITIFMDLIKIMMVAMAMTMMMTVMMTVMIRMMTVMMTMMTMMSRCWS